jgi:hypothetical protein
MFLLLVDLMVHQDLLVQVVRQDLVEHLGMEFHRVEHQVKF